jgi:protein-disulfide isomerase
MSFSLSRIATGMAAMLIVVACGSPAHDMPHDTAATVAVTQPVTTQPSVAQAAPVQPAAAASAPESGSTARTPAGARRVVVGGLDLTGVGYDRGDPKAPVVLVDFSDYGCPFCGSFARETYPTIEREFVKTGKVYFKYVPFVMGMFPNGDKAAHAVECSAEQGKFWEMHEQLYAHQGDWKRTSDPEGIYRGYATAIGIDPARFARCYEMPQVHPRTRIATDAANQLGIRATPTFAVNGQAIEGALPVDAFRQVLQNALAEAKR